MNAELDIDEIVIDSSGDVFRDLDLPCGEEDRLKIAVRAIANVIRKRDLTQTEAAEAIGVDQAKVSALLRGRLRGFSVDRLLKVFSPSRKGRGYPNIQSSQKSTRKNKSGGSIK
jgi:predicted XRE-type DNA-binding protein